MQLDHSNRRLPSNDCFKAVIVLTLTGMSLAGCITLGEDFALENAIKVKNGMTREQEIAVMRSPSWGQIPPQLKGLMKAS